MVTQIGVVMGTIGYMSPEQVRGKNPPMRVATFSALAPFCTRCCRGHRAFQGHTAADLMSAILNHEPPELTATNREISPALDHIVHHCMEKDPQQRFQSAGDIAFQLNELSGMRSSTATRAVVRVKCRPNSCGRGRSRALATTALALLFAATWFLARWDGRITEPPSFVQLTFQQGYVDSARFLPDGQSIICASRWGSDSRLWRFTQEASIARDCGHWEPS